MRLSLKTILCVGLIMSVPVFADEDNESKVVKDKQQFDAKGDWIYNDLDQAYEQAKKTGRPIMAVLRCIPCEECVKLDGSDAHRKTLAKVR